MQRTPITHKDFDQKPVIYGSILEGKVNPDLLEERAKCNFDKEELSSILLWNTYHLHKKYLEEMQKHPILWNRPEHYELSRGE